MSKKKRSLVSLAVITAVIIVSVAIVHINYVLG